MINRVVIVGRLTRDPDYRKNLQTGTPVVTFTVAVDNRQKDAEGNWTSSYIPIVTFGQTAERVSEWARKGSLVGVDGRLNQRSYKREKDGVTVQVIEVIADSVQRLEPKQAGNNESVETPVFDDVNDASEPESNNTDGIDLPEEDLPF